MKKIPAERILPRGRVAQWNRERLEQLTTPDLRALLLNAERLQESEVVVLCREVLAKRPRGNNAAARALRATAK
jgi:hypothetical protein